jgi:hypothetical protein
MARSTESPATGYAYSAAGIGAGETVGAVSTSATSAVAIETTETTYSLA